MDKYKFYKNEIEWFVDLPEYLESGGSIGDLQMVEGADTILDLMAEGKKNISLNISTQQFEGADELILIEKCDEFTGGGYYLMKTYDGKEIDLKMWLCGVVEFVFNEIPEHLFIQKEKMEF